MKHTNFLTTILFTLFSANSFGQFASNSFAPKIDFTTTGSVQGITLGDLNNDGKKELITANIGAGSSIGIFINNSTTGVINTSIFSSSFLLTTLSAQPINVNVADLDGDSKQDIIVTYSNSSNSQFSVFLNQFNGISFNSSSFSRSDFSVGSSNPQGSTIADFDMDGKIDVAITCYASSLVKIFKNTSFTGFISFSSPVSYFTGTGPSSIVNGDIDNDGKIDMAAANWGGGSISILRNTNTTAGIMSFSVQTYSVGTQPNFISITDIDKNGLKEVVCTNYGSNSISLYSNTSSSGISFGGQIVLTVSPYQYTQGLAMNDYDGDGKIDIGVTFAGSPAMLVAKNIYTSGAITSLSFSSFTAFTTNNGPVGLIAGDLDNDLRPDIVSGNYTAQNVSILKNKNLSPEPTIPASNVTAIPSTNSLTINFTKGNGSRRLVVARNSSNTLVPPVDTSFYTASTIFGNGTNIGSNNYVVYGDTGSSVTITGLPYGQTYNFTIYEYNGVGGFSNYLTSSAAAITQGMGDAYFSKSSGALNLLSSWGPNSDGSGTSPSTFYNPNTVFIVVNNPAPTLTANWIVSGTNSFIVIGDGINALNFTIPSGSSLFSDSVAIRSNSTLTFIGGLIGNKAFFDSLSTAQFTSSSAQNIPGFNYYNIVIANSIKTITNNCTVRGALNLLNNINTGTYTLTLGISGSQPGVLNRNANGTITGRFKRWFPAATNTGSSGLFPMLVGTNYRPASVEFATAPTTAGTLTTEFFSIPPGNSGLYLYDFSLGFIEVNKASVNGYWKIDPIALTGGTFTLTLTGTGFYGISVVADLRLVKRQTSGAWTLPSGSTAIAGTGSTAVPVVGRSGYTGFGEFTIAGDSTQNPLPVKWLSFDGLIKDEGILLTWKTANEIDNASFIIERKQDKENIFSPVYTVSPKKSAGINIYSWFDFGLNFEICRIYRIKQVDVDGQVSYSIEKYINKEYGSNEMVYPNPTTEKLHFRGVVDGPFVLYDNTGKGFIIQIVNGIANIQHLSKGLYFLKDDRFKSKILLIE